MNAFGITEIKQVWDIFFMPFIGTVSVFLFSYFLFGKDYIRAMYEKYQLIKIDDVYYRKKYIKIKEKNAKKVKEEKILLLPIKGMSRKTITAMQNPVVFITCSFLVIYIVYRTVLFCSVVYPVRYSFESEKLLLYSVPKFTIAEIWTFSPEYTLDELYDKIDILGEECSYAKYVDYSAIHLFASIFEFCSVLCIINIFIHKPKLLIYIKSLLMLMFCFGAIYCCFYLQLQKDANVLEQKAYYVDRQLSLDDPLRSGETEKINCAMEKVEDELSHINYHSYEVFHIEIVTPKIHEGR